jgi:hypothetical protein
MLHNDHIWKRKDKKKFSRIHLVSVPQDHQPILYAAVRYRPKRIYEAGKKKKKAKQKWLD